MVENFSDFDFVPLLKEGIDAIGFTQPTPVQAETIPTVLEGHDVIACAQTGTGKTAAYLLPVINRIVKEGLHDNGEISALIVVPTRELATQIDQQLTGISYFTPISSIAVYGGGDADSFERQKSALTQGADIIVGTPGRVIAHLNLGYVRIQHLKFLVLDEADRMLDMGFQEDLLKIVSYLPEERQNLLLSATMPPKIRALARKALTDPKEINIAVSTTAEGILQGAYLVYDQYKINLLVGLLKGKEKVLQSVIIFSSTKIGADAIHEALIKLGMSSVVIHSGREQSEREEALRKFRNREYQVLVATDIMSRGIDIEKIDLVINYDVPQDPEDYVHRVGRTARAQSKGMAITFINEDGIYKFQRIEELLGKEIKKVNLPESIGKGPEYKIARKGAGRGKRRNNRRRK